MKAFVGEKYGAPEGLRIAEATGDLSSPRFRGRSSIWNWVTPVAR